MRNMYMDGLVFIGVEEKDKSEILKYLWHNSVVYQFCAAKLHKKNDIRKKKVKIFACVKKKQYFCIVYEYLRRQMDVHFFR